MKPFLRWVGGKGRISQLITSLMPDEVNCYYEPFLGSGAVFLQFLSDGKKAKKYILSDVNNHLTNVWQMVKTNIDDLCNQVTLLIDHYNELIIDKQRELYYQWRNQLNSSDNIAQAAIFMVLNVSAFNALVRYNKQGQFNSAFGKRTHLTLDFHNLHQVSAKLKEIDVEICTASFEKTLEKAAPGDLVYLDPPYFSSENRELDALTYSPDGFALHDEAIQIVQALHAKGIKFLLSNHDCSLIREQLGDFNLKPLSLMKVFSGKSASRLPTQELVVYNIGQIRQ